MKRTLIRKKLERVFADIYKNKQVFLATGLVGFLAGFYTSDVQSVKSTVQVQSVMGPSLSSIVWIPTSYKIILTSVVLFSLAGYILYKFLRGAFK